MPGTAMNMPITAVKTISDTTRGFVSAKNWRARVSVKASVVKAWEGRDERSEATFYSSVCV
jgi:hypothetical protein